MMSDWTDIGPAGNWPDETLVVTLDFHESELRRAAKERNELREALKPFEAFATTTKRMLEMDPGHKITQGSPMAAPQLYARDFLALLDTLANTSREPK